MQKYKDLEFKSTKFDPFLPTLIKEMNKENIRQIDKWGVQDVSIFEWYAYLSEEIGEFIQAIMEYEYRNGLIEDVLKEGIQSMTLLAKMIEFYNLESSKPKGESLDR